MDFTAKIIVLFIISIGIFAFLDIIWLGLIAKKFYRSRIGFLMRSKVKWPAAILFYILYSSILTMLAVLPSVLLVGGRVHAGMSLVSGAILGFFAYMTYELTNYAVIEKWPWSIVIVDVVWGTAASAAVAGITFAIGRVI